MAALREEDQNVDQEGRVSCEHARCGGCGLLGRSLAEQLARKRGHVVEAFGRYRELADVAVQLTAAGTPAVGYRGRGKLVVSREGAVGLYARGSHEVVDIPGCKVLAPGVMAVVG